MAFTTNGLPEQIRKHLIANGIDIVKLTSGANFRYDLELSPVEDLQETFTKLESILNTFSFDSHNANASIIVKHNDSFTDSSKTIIKLYVKGFKYGNPNEKPIIVEKQTDEDFNAGIIALVAKRYNNPECTAHMENALNNVLVVRQKEYELNTLIDLFGEEKAKRMLDLYNKVESGAIEGSIQAENAVAIKRIAAKKQSA